MLKNKDKIRALLKSIETGDPGPVAHVNEAKYVQHNPQTHEGSEGLAALFARLAKTSPRVNMVRGFEDGDFVFAHMEYDFASRKIGFELFRFEEGQAVEHWDNIQDRLEPNASGRSMVDGETDVRDLDLTEENRAIARNFVQSVLINGDVDRLPEFVEDHLIEHSPDSKDGRAALDQHLRKSTVQGRVIDYHRIHRVLAEGNFALTLSEGKKAGRHSAFFDLFRLKDGSIVEHWDTVEKIAPRSEWKNTNGKF